MYQRNLLISLLIVGLLSGLLYLAPRYPKPENLHESGNGVEVSSVDSLDLIVETALMELQSGQGSPMESIMSIRKVLETNPNHLKANFTLGALSYSTGQYERAIERMKKVLEIAPDTEEAYKILTDSYKNLGKTDSAEMIIRDYLARFPDGQFAQELKNISNN